MIQHIIIIIIFIFIFIMLLFLFILCVLVIIVILFYYWYCYYCYYQLNNKNITRCLFYLILLKCSLILYSASQYHYPIAFTCSIQKVTLITALAICPLECPLPIKLMIILKMNDRGKEENNKNRGKKSCIPNQCPIHLHN